MPICSWICWWTICAPLEVLRRSIAMGLRGYFGLRSSMLFGMGLAGAATQAASGKTQPEPDSTHFLFARPPLVLVSFLPPAAPAPAPTRVLPTRVLSDPAPARHGSGRRVLRARQGDGRVRGDGD